MAAASARWSLSSGSTAMTASASTRAWAMTSPSRVTLSRSRSLARPDWAAPSTLPSLRRARSASARAKPSPIRAKARSRW